jgi:hypothetical protein
VAGVTMATAVKMLAPIVLKEIYLTEGH